MQHVVGIAEMCVSESAADTLTTYSLGSCIGLSVYTCIISSSIFRASNYV